MSKTTINQTKLPKARTSEIVVQYFDSEVLVYDLSSNKAHHLNKTIATVWKHCDGKTTIDKISELLTEQLDTKIEEDFVSLALDELDKVSLLEEEIKKSEFTKLSRRKVLFRYALPAISLPLVMSLVAPKSIHAQSCLQTQGENCVLEGTPCCTGSLICQDNIGFGFPTCEDEG